MMKKHRWRRIWLYRMYMFLKALFAQICYGFPGSDMIFLGVTGTDGKSTTNELLYHILKEAGYKVGLISTVTIDVGEDKQSNETKLTSLSHGTFASLLEQAKSNGLTHMVIEPSSHALYQYRLWPVKFTGVGRTNLTHEHLDFHWTMEHYARTKAELFSNVTKESKGIYPYGFAYIDMLKSMSKAKNLSTFGYDRQADIWVSDIVENPYLSYKLHMGPNRNLSINSQMLGRFNAENMMIAAGLAEHLGVNDELITSGLHSFPGLAGRQELVKTKQGITAMIDFALTPDGLETLYTAVGSLGFTRILAVFGATGNRDQGKRPLMGEIATRLCDYVIITEDENYDEDGMTIMRAVEKGIEQGRENYTLIQDRTDAIKHALSEAKSGDVVIITGMANFTTRAMNKGKIPWNERKVIEESMIELHLELIE